MSLKNNWESSSISFLIEKWVEKISLSVLSVIARQQFCLFAQRNDFYSHRKANSLSFPGETILFLNNRYFFSLAVTAPPKHLHQCRSKCWQQLGDTASLSLNGNICLLVYFCNASHYEKCTAYAPLLSRDLFIFRERYWHRKPRDGEQRQTG